MHGIHATEFYYFSVISSKPIYSWWQQGRSIKFSTVKGRKNNLFFIWGSPSCYCCYHRMHLNRLNWPPLAPCAAEITAQHHINLDCQTLAAVGRQDHCRTDLCDQMDVVWLNSPSEITAFPQDLLLSPLGLQWDFSSTDNSRIRGSGPHIMGFSAMQFGEGWTEEKESSDSMHWQEQKIGCRARTVG